MKTDCGKVTAHNHGPLAATNGIVNAPAILRWNDTMHSYLDDSVYPPHQTVIVRCEDFLFSHLAGFFECLNPCCALKSFKLIEIWNMRTDVPSQQVRLKMLKASHIDLGR